MCITLFCTFLCCHCMTTTWKCLISHFMEDVWHFQRIGINATMFEKTRMPFQTDVFAARAPYSFEGAVKKFHLFPVKDSIADRFRDTSLVPSPCLLARRDFFFSHLLIYLLMVASFGRVTERVHDANYCGPVAFPFHVPPWEIEPIMHRGLCPYLSSNSSVGSFTCTSPSNW